MVQPTVITALNRREEEIARLVARGHSNDEVAQRLSLRQDAVENCLSRVYEKLGVSSHIEVLFYVLSHHKNPESENSEIAEKTFRVGT
jgi:DNA-binding NarL/FixJ family response regulator